MVSSLLLFTAWLARIITAQQLQCTFADGGCNKGSKYDSSVRSAAAKFGTTKLYGGTDDTVIFSSTLDSTGTIIAGISYSCTDGSKPPAVYGSVIKHRIDQILTCANRCGSVSVTADAKCGLGILISDGADAQCFSQAGNVNPSGQQQPELPSSGTFDSIGCWTDSASARTLTGGSSTASDMTVEKCVALAAGYKYAGVEYGVECFWGNTIASTGVQAFGTCTMACGGNLAELCGDGNRLNVYQNTAYQPPAQEVASLGTFVTRGCHSDSQSARALSNSYTNWDTMSVELCLKLAAGYRYAAVEYYGECYWGNELASSSVPLGSGCNTPCAGAHSELCGGGNAINLYENTAYQAVGEVPAVGSYVLRGCYVDSAASRTLQDGVYQDWSSMTVQMCAEKASSYRYMGVEYYGECYYGDTLHGTLASVPCDTPCAGDPSQICGGGNLITVYEDASWSDPTREELAGALISLVYGMNSLREALADWHEAAAAAASNPSRMMHKRDPLSLLGALNNVRSVASSVSWRHTQVVDLRRRAGARGTITGEENQNLIQMDTYVDGTLQAVDDIEDTTSAAAQAAVATSELTALGLLNQHWWEATELFGFILILAAALAPSLFEQQTTATTTAGPAQQTGPTTSWGGSLGDSIFNVPQYFPTTAAVGEGVRLLSFDAEDVRCISELYVLKQIMLNIQAAEGLPAIPRPADYFDLMGGTGVGGMFAILFGRVGLYVDDVLDDLGLGDEEKAGFLLSVETWQTAGDTDAERANANSAELINTVMTILQRYGVDPVSAFKNNGLPIPTFVTSLNALNLGGSENIGSYNTGMGPSPSMEEVMRITLSHSSYFNLVTIPGQGALLPSRHFSADLTDFNPGRQVHLEARMIFGRNTHLSAFVSLGSGDRRVGLRGPSHEPNADFDSRWLRVSRVWVEDPWDWGEILGRQFGLLVYHRFSVPSPGFFNLDEDRMETNGIVEWVRQVTNSYLMEPLVVARLNWVTQLLINRPNLGVL